MVGDCAFLPGRMVTMACPSPGWLAEAANAGKAASRDPATAKAAILFDFLCIILTPLRQPPHQRLAAKSNRLDCIPLDEITKNWSTSCGRKILMACHVLRNCEKAGS